MTLIRRLGMKPLRDEICDYLAEHPTANVAGGIDIRGTGNIGTRLEQHKHLDSESHIIYFYVDKTEELTNLLRDHDVDPCHTNNLLELYEYVCEWLATINVRHEENPLRVEVVKVAERIKSAGIQGVTIHFSDHKKSKMQLKGSLAKSIISKALMDEAQTIGERPPGSGRPVEPHTEAMIFLSQLAQQLFQYFPSKQVVYDFLAHMLDLYNYPVSGLEDLPSIIRKAISGFGNN